ncbi:MULTISPECIES: class C sortase [unclassified Enterococcus]|jgi:sortase A|uniref:class C sortase n=1 Tax=unclassified Enterococcus TaxID=2608891 RepID=UPI003D273AED
MVKSQQKESKKQRTNLIINILIVLLFATGVGVFSYPFFVDSLNNYLSQKMMERHQREIAEQNQINREQALEDMAAENEKRKQANNIVGIGLMEDLFDQRAGRGDYPAEYFEERLLGALYIPKIRVSLPIFNETNDVLLEKGTTLLQGTSYPVGGESTHSVITGHTGLPDKMIFTELDKLEKGDQFFLEVMGEKLAYKVDQIQVILPEEVESLAIQEGRDLVTLLTCTPYMINSHRLLVTGYRVPYVEEMTEKIQNTKNHHNIRLLIFGILLAVFLILFFYWLWRKIVYYRSTKRLYRLKFYWMDGQTPRAGQTFLLLNRKGTPLNKEKTIAATSQSDGKVDFGELPGNIYRIRLNGEKPIDIKAKIWRTKNPQFSIAARGRYLRTSKIGKNYFIRKRK